ncbi:tetrahydromethanopterin:alpha-L-glutamate ligase [Methanotorris formicicus]|uniref:Alpha-L-glutamate ligase, RimK family n=1 Tax=Methanotorris formicicus Mc-S-70 TaxID=647171 RepID=H1KYJ3_9EURY|nr:tetrahydromethanopterin:alpha-L-glutamate ligase [Methanotorris formicicus]EHP87033.1 alpha-L-glutamate ligase, RimK family [Methanotorris formicicus Mc-S-70]
MKMGIISEEKDWVVNELKKSMEKNGIKPEIIKPSNIISGINIDFRLKCNNKNLLDLDCAFVRNIGDEVEMFHRFDFLKHLEHYIPLINPLDGIENAGNKYRCSFLMDLKNIPQPKTVVTESIDEALEWVNTFEDCVIKPLFGNQGRGIIRINGGSLISKLNKLTEFKKKYGSFYIQEFVKNPNNVYRDIRAFVVGDEVVSAMYRVSDNWITNIHQNAKPEECEINEEIEELAIKAKDALGLVYAGVDLIEGRKGLKVLEVNATPSWEGLSKISKTNIADRIIEEVVNLLKR